MKTSAGSLARALRITPEGYAYLRGNHRRRFIEEHRCPCGAATFASDKLCPGCRDGREGFGVVGDAVEVAP